jgi:ankyrin repeat protein
MDATDQSDVTRFFEAAEEGDVELLRSLLNQHPALVHAGNPAARHERWTALHTAAKAGHVDAVRLLLDRGADLNAREPGSPEGLRLKNTAGSTLMVVVEP